VKGEVESMTSAELDKLIDDAEQEVIALKILQDLRMNEYHEACERTRQARRKLRELRDQRHLVTATAWCKIAVANGFGELPISEQE
jgi:hypothetical protein